MSPIDELTSPKVQKKLMGMCMKKTKNIDKAKELRQNVMLKALKYIESYEDHGKMMAWLSNICHSVHIDTFRKNQNIISCEIKEWVDLGERNEGEYFGEIEFIFEKINELNEREARVIEMIIDGESYESMRKDIGVGLGNLKAIINRTKHKLAKKVGVKMIKQGGFEFI